MKKPELKLLRLLPEEIKGGIAAGPIFIGAVNAIAHLNDEESDRGQRLKRATSGAYLNEYHKERNKIVLAEVEKMRNPPVTLEEFLAQVKRVKEAKDINPKLAE